jgi:5-methylcytosine-specific restriction endonuclease McrA
VADDPAALINNAIGTRCELCNQPLLPHERLHVDHRLARKYGGTDDPANLRVVHGACNLRRGAGKPPVWMTTR